MVRQLGIAQVMTEKNPELHAGDTVRHTLILYNDEFTGNDVDIQVALKSGSQTLSMVNKNIVLQLVWRKITKTFLKLITR